jgi:hypothetical protein
VIVHFAYQGFTQNGNQRCYSFNAVEDHKPTAIYAISVDLSLFAKHHVSLQNGPMFCLKILNSASQAGPGKLEECRNYQAIEADFDSLLSERAALAAAAASKKPPRRFGRKPPPTSQLSHLGRPHGEEAPFSEPKVKS